MESRHSSRATRLATLPCTSVSLVIITDARRGERVADDAAERPLVHTAEPDAGCMWDHVHLRVDGPYGAGSEHVFDYEVAVLVRGARSEEPTHSERTLSHRTSGPTVAI